MKRVFIASESALASVGGIADLTAGQIGVFGMNKLTNLFEIYNPANTYDFIQFYVGGEALPSGRIDMSPAARKFRAFRADYKAPIKQIDNFVVATMFGTNTYDEFTLTVSPISTEPYEFSGETFSVVGIFANAAAVYNALADKVNAKSKWATASVSGGGLAITTKDYGYGLSTGLKFTKDEISLCGDPCVLPVITKTTPTLLNVGNGTAKDVTRLDYLARPFKGNMASYLDADLPIPSVYSGVDTFDIITLTYSNSKDASGTSAGDVFEMEHDLTFAVPAGGALSDALVVFIDTLNYAPIIESALV